MARPLRIEYKGAFYHVMNRGNAHQNIFKTPKHYEIFLELLSEAVNLWEIKIHAFSLLPNHYHMLIETPLGNLSRAMRHINGVYTQRFNRYNKRDGHLFRGRYKAILVEDDAYLIELLRYIHLNPVKAGLCKSPEEYIWSSHRDYLNNKNRDFLNTSLLLSYFGKRQNLARRKLHEFVLEGVPEKLAKRLDSVKWPSVFGSDNFEDWVKWNFVKDIESKDLQYEAHNIQHVSERSLKSILCNVLELRWKNIANPKTLEDRRKRAIAILLYRRYLKYTYSELANIFNLKPARISRIMNEELKISSDIEDCIDSVIRGK